MVTRNRMESLCSEVEQELETELQEDSSVQWDYHQGEPVIWVYPSDNSAEAFESVRRAIDEFTDEEITLTENKGLSDTGNYSYVAFTVV